MCAKGTHGAYSHTWGLYILLAISQETLEGGVHYGPEVYSRGEHMES